MNNLFSIHHVGARNGARTFPILDKFESDFQNVMYDADPECLEQVEEKNSGLQSSLVVLPYCIDGEVGKKNFYINADPYTSSLREKCSSFDDFCMYHGKTDYLVKDTMAWKEKIEVECKTFDNMFHEGHFERCLPPDFLSLDTQGTELDILEGSTSCLKNIIGIAVEGEFVSYYKGQRKIYELMEFLDKNKFIFSDILYLEKGVFCRAPIGMRGDGVLSHLDMLFLKRPNVLVEEILDKQTLECQLKKLAFTCFVYEQFELGNECLDLLEKEFGEVSLLDDRKYEYFLRELNVVRKEHHRFPLRYAVSFSKAKELFSKNGGERDESLKYLRYIYRKIRVKFLKYKAIVASKLTVRHTNVEKLFIHYGLLSQAKKLKKRRKFYI